MRDQFELATTVPFNEPCVQLGAENYSKWSRLEATALISQIKRQLGEPPRSTQLKVVSCPHDFGTYHDVVVVYDDALPESEEYMLNIESQLPEEWDEESKKFLRESGYPVGEYHPGLR